jgi:TPP-dependent 2-oxoacid decarboxylase
MAKWATGKRSQAISDRSGMAFPYTEMVKEWNGSLVHYSEFEPKHPQIRRRHATSDAIALQNTRSQRFQQPQTVASNDTTVANSGGTMVGVADLTLPGNFSFITAQPENVLTSAGVVISTMKPADPSLQNRRRKLIITTGTVTVSIT